jgi:hypothetical protein
MRIKLEYIAPPIPSRNFDWSAIDSDTYDASYEGEDENGHHWKASPQGFGASPQEAIDDLMEQLGITEVQESSAT